VKEILKRLEIAYPDAKCALKHVNPFQLLIATILSAQCTDERVNMVTPGLFKKYPTPQDFVALRPEVLEAEIRSTGFYRNKTKSILGASQKIVKEFGGKVPQTMEELLRLPGVARKTANVVLGTAFGKATGVVVDTHVTRIAQRLDLSKEKTPEKIEQDLVKLIPQDQWIDFAHEIIFHGRRCCTARKPHCPACPVEDLCYSKDKIG
jgi:endonuclease-3